ncbi:MAG: PEP-CTERM sorting domain-containing protein [Akkermansiaceae bacterium]
MKLIIKNILCGIAFLYASGSSATAQNLNLGSWSLLSGVANQTGASYLFKDIVSDVNAVIQIEHTENAQISNFQSSVLSNILQPDMSSAGSSSPYAPHYIDFSVQFFANDHTAVALESLNVSILDVDAALSFINLSAPFAGNIIKFAQVTSHDTLPHAQQGNSSVYSGDTSFTLGHDTGLGDLNLGLGSQLVSENYTDVHALNIRMGWYGADTSSVGPIGNLIAVPEPSSAALTALALFPLVFRRKR